MSRTEIEAPSGRVVLLDGVSGSGKSSLAAELTPMLSGFWYRMSRDSFNAMREHVLVPSEKLETALDRLVAGYHRAVAGMAAAGNSVVADHLLRKPSWTRDWLQNAPVDAVLVAVRCSLPELRRREREREDRAPGLVDRQYGLVHRELAYDLEVDSEKSSPRECAAEVARFLTREFAPQGMRRSRRALGLDPG